MTVLSAKSLKALDLVDAMPGDLRECVHDFGLPIVSSFTKWGIKNPVAIREILREIWHGARQQGQRADALNSADVMLMRGDMNLRTCVRFLADNNQALVPCEATRAMLDASMAEVSGYNVRCSREEKHRRRLRAAIRAGMNETLERVR